MYNPHGLTAENLLAALPQVLREDEGMYALASAAAGALAARPDEIDRLRIYARIDELPEELLDILAYDFKVDWWDYRYTVEQKRRTLRDSFLVHKRLGTKYAVKTALSAIYPNSTIQEWFEYGGEPYTFRLLVNVSGQVVEPELYFRAIDLTNYYKNLRSHLRGVEYTMEAKEPAVLRVGGTMAIVSRLAIPEIADTFAFEDAMYAGGQMASVVRFPMPALQDDITLSCTGRVSVTGAVSVTIPLPEITS